MAYMFGTRDAATAADAAVARTMQDYLYNFVVSGDPNGGGPPHWPRATAPDAPMLVVDRTIRAVPGFRARQLRPFLDMAAKEAGGPVPQ